MVAERVCKTRFARPCLFGAMTVWLGLPAHAQPYPAKPVRIVIPYAAGGTTYVMALMFGQKLGESLGQQFIVDPRPGAGGNVGAELVAKSAPNGYTVLMGNVTTHAINVSLYAKLPFDAVKDFVPITQTVLLNMALVVHPSLPVKSVQELIALAKARPGQLNYGSGGIGTAPHLAAELFNQLSATRMQHIAYKGNVLSIADLLGGHIVLIFDNLAVVLPHVKTGRLRAIAGTGGQRSSQMPELPTIAETGLPGFEVTGWHGLFAPAGTPRDIVQRLSGEIARIVGSADVRQQLARDGVDPVGSTPDQFAAFQRSEIAKWAQVVKISGAKAE